jgi:hypothetical protein
MLAVRPPKEEPEFFLFRKDHSRPSSQSPVQQDVLAAQRLAAKKVAEDSRPITAMQQDSAAAGNVTPGSAPPPKASEQPLVRLDTWLRSGLPAKDFAALVGLSKHT